MVHTPIHTNGTFGWNSGGYNFGLLTEDEYQWVAYVGHLSGTGSRYYIARRKHDTKNWDKVTNLSAAAGSTLGNPAGDGHNVLSIGIDSEGYLHAAGNNHADPLKIMKSVNPGDPSSWVSTKPGLSVAEEQATYPVFIRRTNGELLFLFRGRGGSGVGNEIVFVWNGAAWEYRSTVIDGVNSVPDQSLYRTYHYDRQRDRLHMLGSWRTTTDATTFHDLVYAYTDDGGVSWKDSEGDAWPASPVMANVPKIYTIPEGQNLLAPSGIAVDDEGYPHAAVTYADGSGTTKLWHHYQDATGWHRDPVALYDRGVDDLFSLTGGKVFRRPNGVLSTIFVDSVGGTRATAPAYRYMMDLVGGTPEIIQPQVDVDSAFEPVIDDVALYERGEIWTFWDPVSGLGEQDGYILRLP